MAILGANSPYAAISSGSNMSISSDGSIASIGRIVAVSPGDVRTPPPPRDVLDDSLSISGLSIRDDGTDASGTVPQADSGSPVDAFLMGAVLKLTLPLAHYNPRCSYALYYGNGRVIHSWSNMRTSFRVRVDTLRSLKARGVTVEDASDELDAFCAKVLGATPLPPDEIAARAREALHCETSSRRSSIVLIAHARYGAVATTMAKSLLMIAPVVVKLNKLGEEWSTGAISLRHALGIVLHYIDHKNYRMPEMVRVDEEEDERVVPTVGVLRDKAAALDTIQGLLRSDVEPFLAAWIMIALKKGDPQASTVAVVVAQLKRAKASLFFSPFSKAFTIVLTSDANLLERLVRERMECGICFANYNDLPTKLLECSHVLCGICLASLHTRVCPYCREPITFEREITGHYKALANKTIRGEERRQMEDNDFDAPPCAVTPPSSAGSDIYQDRLSSLLAIRAALARALTVDDDDDDDDVAMILQRDENEKRESEHMANEDGV